MVAVKFATSTIKKLWLSLLFPLVYMIPVVILIFVKILYSYGEIYQNYMFMTNSKFEYINEVGKFYENVFWEDYYHLQSHYSEERSIARQEYYSEIVSSNIYFYFSEIALEYSYFNNKNLLKGEIPNEKLLQECQQEGLYPIALTYEAAKELRVGLGDYVYYIYDYGTQDKPATIKITFKVTGILLPDGSVSSEKREYKVSSSPISCAMLDKDLLVELARIRGGHDSTYLLFSNKKMTHNSVSKQQLLDTLPIGSSAIMDLIFVVIAVVIISSFTLKILIIKFAKDIENLRKLGMRLNSASLFYFIHCTWILSATILVSFVFIRFFYSIYIVNNYFDWQLLLGISLIIFLAGSIYNAVSSILKIRFAGGKS